MPEPLTPDELAAITAFAKEHGRTWKADLRDLWMRAAAPATLHRLRNTHGPSWLESFQIPKSNASPSGRDRFHNFREMIRAEGFSMICRNQIDNFELWEITGPKGYTQIAVIIGEAGFDLFFASENLAMKDDVEMIRHRIG